MIDLFASAALLLFLDQLSKTFAEVYAGERSIAVGTLLRLRHVASIKRRYTSDTGRALLVLLWLASLASAIILYRTPAFHSRAAMMAFGAAIGGAAGNLIDILHTRSVSDFIDFSFWPTFNLADAAIVCGLAVAFWQRF